MNERVSGSGELLLSLVLESTRRWGHGEIMELHKCRGQLHLWVDGHDRHGRMIVRGRQRVSVMYCI